MTPEFIIIHHSATKDGVVNDWEAIRRYHKSWRYQGNIITEAEARARIANGVRGVESPWLDIGYHFGIEQEGTGVYIWKPGRQLTMDGAHCTEQGMNRRSIGICVVGNYDIDTVPAPMLAMLVDNVKTLTRNFSIPIDHVKRHCDYASYKTCPGVKFPWSEFLVALA